MNHYQYMSLLSVGLAILFCLAPTWLFVGVFVLVFLLAREDEFCQALGARKEFWVSYGIVIGLAVCAAAYGIAHLIAKFR